MTILANCPQVNPAADRHVEPVILVGTLEDQSPVLLKADSGGNLMYRSSTGMGWTVAGDATTVSYDDPLKDVYSLRIGGLDGPVVQTITIAYSDTLKNKIISVARA